MPGSIDAVLKGDRLVIAYTDAATREALAPKSKLGDSPDFQSASSSLNGAVPALYLSFPPIAELAAAASPGSAAQIKQYLRPLHHAGGRDPGQGQPADRALRRQPEVANGVRSCNRTPQSGVSCCKT